MNGSRPWRWWVGVGLLVLGGCAGPRTAARAAAAAPVPDEIGRLGRLGVDVATVASAVWPGWNPRRIPFCIVHQRDQWLFQASGRPAGYDPRSYTSPLGSVFHATALLEGDGRRRDPPSSFFARTSRDDDAGDGSIVFVIAAPEQGFPVAAWVQVFVHEYFHTFQMAQRWPVDMTAFDDARPVLGADYDQPSYRQLVGEELAMERALIDRLETGHRLQPPDLSPLVEHRRRRRAALGAFATVESALETIEGTARFVDQSVGRSPPVRAVLRAAGVATEPTTREEQLRAGLGIEGNRYWYATGYGLVQLLEEVDPRWHDELGKADLADLLAQLVAHQP